MVVRTVIQRGPKEKKAAVFAVDWPGWSRGAKAPDAAVELLETYRERYRPIARLAGLGPEFDRSGPLEIVEDHVGVGSTDFWGISFAPSSFELAPMPEDELERKLALLHAAWQFFDDVAARVSPQLEKGPRAAVAIATRSSATSSATSSTTWRKRSASSHLPTICRHSTASVRTAKNSWPP